MLEKQIALENGLKLLSENQQITFIRYVRLVLPVDGFVFWVKKSLINGSNGALNGQMLNSVPLNGQVPVIEPDSQFTVDGSFHYAANNVQENTQVYGKNYVTFTTLSDIDDFNDIGESELFIGTFDEMQFAFSQRGKFYRGAGLFHYTGEAINPIMRSQIIDDLSFFDDSKIVADSLPIFMALNSICPVYPAFRGKQNIRPPFISVDVTETIPLMQYPQEAINSDRRQWCKDTVTVTAYGLNNNKALDYLWLVLNAGLEYYSDFGINNAPVFKKLDIPQSELNVTANAKTAVFEINYYQDRAVNIARALIEQAFVSVINNPFIIQG